jgi:hypothetical protein
VQLHIETLKIQRLLLVQPTLNFRNPVFNVRGSVHRKNILVYIQQDATLHSLFYPKTALHVSYGTPSHHQERKQLYLQHLAFVRRLLLPAVIMCRSTCFERLHSHHQELTTALTASEFTLERGGSSVVGHGVAGYEESG